MRAVFFLAITAVASAVRADEFFSKQIEPLLKEHCYECHSHSSGKMKGGLTLDSKSGWEQGGDEGPALVPGKPDESLLLKMVRWSDEDHQMPPKVKLPEEKIALLTDWVKRGAPDPRTAAPPVAAQFPAETWWSLKPLEKPALPPDVGATAGETNPVDRFIRAGLEKRKIAPSPEADRRTLMRRLYFDLHGLPPHPDDVAAFEADTDPLAYEMLVDRLLLSPRHGERWARHWLDAIHFAETHGCGHDLPRDHAWRFRDYVIAAFNHDTPWPRFVREQLAADQFFPEQSGLTVALGFLGAGVFDHSAFETAPTNFDYLDRDDMVTQTMGAFTSTTASCARCHAHKFDPISQEDYYALQAVFAGVVEGNVPFDEDASVARQRKRWQTLLAAADAQDKAALFNEENTALVQAWEADRPKPAAWTTLDYESFVSAEGASLGRQGDLLVSSRARPDKEVYLITATSSLGRVTALRLDVLTDKTLPKDGPGRQDNGNLTLTEFEVRVFAPGAATPTLVKFARASADFNQQGWAISAALDGNPATGWGIFPAVGQPHLAVFELAEPLVLKPDSKLAVSLKQQSGNGHLIGRFKLSATDEDPVRAMAMPSLAEEALNMPAKERTEAQQLALHAHVLRLRADEELKQLPAPSVIYAAGKKAEVLLAVGKGTPRTLAKAREVNVLRRGDFDKPVAQARPGALAAVASLKARFDLAPEADESARRAALADWIADDRNPLTWRSIANRVWHHHFGRGLCDSPNDFGRMGSLPSHPALLDWLACELRDHGGSLKHLHRIIVTSATYRQRSDHREEPARQDGENRLLWRMSRLRLDADSYRDSVLAAAGALDSSMGGPSVRQFITGPPVQLTPTLDYLAYDWSSRPAHRRSIYRFVWRGVPDPFMDVLDFPDLGMLAPARGFSASSLQSLALYNNAFVLHFSRELEKQSTSTAELVRRILLRHPTEDELREFGAYAAQHGMAALCRVLLNSNEFLFVD